MQTSRPRLVLFAAASLLLMFLMLEVFLRLATPALERALGMPLMTTSTFIAEHAVGASSLLDDSTTRTVLDSVVGWRYRPGFASAQDSINLAGLRGSREYGTTRQPGIRRIAAFGDSFVYGTEVSNSESWAAVLDRQSDSIEVLNYGVGGYGTDQALLLYLRNGAEFAPDVVLIGFAPIDLARTQSVYPRFISAADAPVVKPRFAIDGEALRLIPNPLPTRSAWHRTVKEPRRILDVGKDDAWYDAARFENPLFDRLATVRVAVTLGLRVWRKYFWSDRVLAGPEFRPESESFVLQLRLLEAFADSVRGRGATPVVVMFPDNASLARVLGADSRERGSTDRAVYAPLVDSLRARDRVRVLDALEAFAEAGGAEDVPGWFAPGLHYSASGNDVVGRWLHRALAELPSPAPVTAGTR